MAGQNLTALSFPLIASGVDLLQGNDRIWNPRLGRRMALRVSATGRMKCGTSASVVVFLCGSKI